MIVRFKELDDDQINSIETGTIVLDYQMHPHVVIKDTDNGWYLEDMSGKNPLSMFDGIPIYDVDDILTYTYIEKDDYVAFADWNVIL